MIYHILLTIDVEDWFQVENLRQACPVTSWPSYELRVEGNTHRILDLLDSIELQNKGDRIQEPGGAQDCPVQNEQNRQTIGNERTKKSPKATFFVLGWIAERLPNLVREIHARGHEIASHGYGHELCTKLSVQELERDLIKGKNLLEDITGAQVYGYRAPSFSVSDDILKIIEDCGFLYDSSYNSFSMHGRYGKISLNTSRAGIAHRIAGNFMELPISNLPIFSFPILGNLAHFRHFSFPLGGGAYFRLIPFPLFRLGAGMILRREGAYLFYFHPWEIDHEQPRIEGVKWMYRLRHSINLDKSYSRLSKLITDFAGSRFVTCKKYLNCAAEAYWEKAGEAQQEMHLTGASQEGGQRYETMKKRIRPSANGDGN
jgi:polysaccharide deacetylase family protein (PEP-CTERM system associated)